MKLTTQKLLLSLYSQSDQLVQFPYQLIELILPDLTPGGQRSLLHLLNKQGHLHKETVSDQITLTISDQGRKALQQQFPALKQLSGTRQGQWQLILFLLPPARDKNFRYLRNLVLAAHGLPVTRGVYAFPLELPAEIKHILDHLYKENVLIVAAESQLGFGSLRKIIVEYYRLPDLVSAYSGVSSEIKQLLRQFESVERLTDGQKSLPAMVLDRISQNATQDPGITETYYPGSPNLSEVIRDFQELIRLVFTKF